jgi:predicted phosphodiesterase
MTDHRYDTVAVLADIHANLPALEAVLAAAEAAGAEAFVLLGDIALGPMPAPTLDLLARLGDRAIWVHGNCERAVVAAFDTGRLPEPNAQGALSTAALLGRGHRDRLDGLPLTVTLEIAGLGPTLFCHASPRKDDEMMLVDSPPELWSAVLAGVSAQTVVVGHTHMQFDRLAAGHRVVNAGSVGMPYGPIAGACWALLGPDVTLRRTRYDTSAAAERIAASDYEGADQWAADYVLQQASDTEALAVFTQIARDQAAARQP